MEHISCSYSELMSRLNKKALYQLATTNGNSTFHEPFAEKRPAQTDSAKLHHCASLVEAEFTLEMVELRPIPSSLSDLIPDGRISGKIHQSSVKTTGFADAISVSVRAHKNGNSSMEGYKRREVMEKLGSGSLGLLANAYMEQQIMTDEEIHSVQQRFYGLQAV